MEQNTVAVVSLVSGVVSILLGMCACGMGFIPIVNFLSWLPMGLAGILSLVAVVTGGLGISKANQMNGAGKGQAIGGLSLGCLGVMFMALNIAIIFGAMAMLGIASVAGG